MPHARRPAPYPVQGLVCDLFLRTNLLALIILLSLNYDMVETEQSSNPTPSETGQPSNSLDEESNVVPETTKRFKSNVWNHFVKIQIDGNDYARCLHCNKQLCAASKNGNTSLRDHIKKRCPRKHVKLDIRQQSLNRNTKSNGKSRLENYSFDQESSRKELVNITMHDYPLAIVEHLGFRRFVARLNPNFKMISRNTLKSDIMKSFEINKATLKKMFENHKGRIAITTDM